MHKELIEVFCGLVASIEDSIFRTIIKMESKAWNFKRLDEGQISEFYDQRTEQILEELKERKDKIYTLQRKGQVMEMVSVIASSEEEAVAIAHEGRELERTVKNDWYEEYKVFGCTEDGKIYRKTEAGLEEYCNDRFI